MLLLDLPLCRLEIFFPWIGVTRRSLPEGIDKGLWQMFPWDGGTVVIHFYKWLKSLACNPEDLCRPSVTRRGPNVRNGSALHPILRETCVRVMVLSEGVIHRGTMIVHCRLSLIEGTVSASNPQLVSHVTAIPTGTQVFCLECQESNQIWHCPYGHMYHFNAFPPKVSNDVV